MNRLVLIDGNAILHRAYHALPPLTAPDGSVVNAVYGFTSILIKIFNDLKPTHMVVAFDRPEPTFRKKMFADYQGKRPEMDSDLVSQIPKVQDVVRAFGIPIYDKAGFEADDVIGSITKQCRMLNAECQIDEVVIVTGDKDILQLVDDKKGVKVFMPTKGLSEGKLYGEAEVVERLGVTPKQIPELKALMGDSSDNYPGVAGIGPKTAVGLIGSFGTIEKLYQTIGKSNQESRIRNQGKKLSSGVKDKLLKGEEMGRMSKDLATIRIDVPIVLKPLVLLETLDTPEARKKLQEFHFPSLLKRLMGVQDGKTGRQKDDKTGRGERTKSEEKAGEQQELF